MNCRTRFHEFDRRYFGGALGRAGWRVITRPRYLGWDEDANLDWFDKYGYRGRLGERRTLRVPVDARGVTVYLSRTIIVLPRQMNDRQRNTVLLHEMAHAHLALLNGKRIPGHGPNLPQRTLATHQRRRRLHGRRPEASSPFPGIGRLEPI